MLFNSIAFIFFYTIFFVVYWTANKKIALRNTFILISSYVFYGWWDWRFLGLIFLSTVVDYVLGLKIGSTDNVRSKKIYLSFSLLANLSILGYFKYYNFFIESFVDFLGFFGLHTSLSSLNIILPVGISFYTFQTLSYTIDIYRGEFKPTRNFIQFAAFVSFFPQLVAGPIERAKNLLPQFERVSKFSYKNAKIGLSQILWGFFKKVVVADNCAVLVDSIFDGYGQMSPELLVLGGVLFAFQIYCDFSGYSDIAIGISRLLGFSLMTNFRYPYFSRDIAEFWRRWHISLSTWFRDYLYIPLGGSRVGFSRKIVNTFAIFLVSGFWHGDNWTFIIWGGLNAIYFIPLLVLQKNRQNLNSFGEQGLKETLKEIPLVVLTFTITCLAWIFFRAPSLRDAYLYIKGIVVPYAFDTKIDIPIYVYCMILFLLIIDFLNRKKDFVFFKHTLLQVLFLMTVGLFILLFGYFSEERSFIYFQF